MAAKLSKFVVGLLAVGSLGIAAPAQAEEPPCVGYTGLLAVCVFPFACDVVLDPIECHGN